MTKAARLTDTDRAMLALLTKKPQRASWLGERLWGNKNVGANCSCPWARPAGKVLHRLKRAGLAEHVHNSRWDWGWVKR